MKYDQVYYSWLRSGDFPNIHGNGWGIARSSNHDPVFCRKAAEVMKGRKASNELKYAEYFEFSRDYNRFIHVGVRNIPSLPEMQGGENNKLIHLYVAENEGISNDPTAEFPPLDYYDNYSLESGNSYLPVMEIPQRNYDYLEILKEYGFSEADGETGIRRLAELLALEFLLFVSDEWKRILFPVNLAVRNPYDTAREITWLMHTLVPQRIFDKNRNDLRTRLEYRVSEDTAGNTLSFVPAETVSGSLKDHVFNLNPEEAAAENIILDDVDRRLKNCGPMFFELAQCAQKSRDDYFNMLDKLKQNSHAEISSLNALNHAYIQWKNRQKLISVLNNQEMKCIQDNGKIISDFFQCCDGKRRILDQEVLDVVEQAASDQNICLQILQELRARIQKSGEVNFKGTRFLSWMFECSVFLLLALRSCRKTEQTEKSLEEISDRIYSMLISDLYSDTDFPQLFYRACKKYANHSACQLEQASMEIQDGLKLLDFIQRG